MLGLTRTRRIIRSVFLFVVFVGGYIHYFLRSFLESSSAPGSDCFVNGLVKVSWVRYRQEVGEDRPIGMLVRLGQLLSSLCLPFDLVLLFRLCFLHLSSRRLMCGGSTIARGDGVNFF